MSDVAQCADLVRVGDPERFAVAMTAPPGPDRDAMMVLYAFNLELARAPYVTAEPMIAQMRLQWWRDALDEIAAGGTVRRHEVVTPLADLLARRGLSTGPLLAMVDAREWDIAKDPFAEIDSLKDHLRHTGGMLMQVTAAALGGDADAARTYGRGVALANWLRAFPAIKASGRTPLPQMSGAALQALLTEGRDLLKAGRKDARGGNAALRAGYLADGVLRRALADPDAIPEGRLEPSEFTKRGRLLWLALTGGF